ncbi:hypothetical protein [Streptomyces sp. NPDC002746]
MSGEEYVQAAAMMKRRIAAPVAEVASGRLTEEAAHDKLAAINREGEGLHAVAAAELVVLEAVLREQRARIEELEQRLGG